MTFLKDYDKYKQLLDILKTLIIYFINNENIEKMK